MTNPEETAPVDLIDHFKNPGTLLEQLKAMKHLWVGSKQIAVASGLITVFSLGLPLTLMQVYDRVIRNHTTDTLIWLVFGCIIAFSLEWALRYARSWISSWMAARFEHLLSCSAVNRLLSGQLARFQAEEVGVHLDRLNTVGQLKSFYAGQAFQMLLDLPFLVLFLLAIGFVGGWLVLFPIVMILLYLWVIKYFKQGLETAQNEQSVQTDRRYNFIIEILDAISQVKSLTMEEQMLRRYERLQANAATSNMRVNFWNAMPSNIGFLFSQAIMFGTIGFGAGRVLEGTLTVGGLTACTMLGGRSLGPVQAAATFWLKLSEADLLQEKISKIARTEPDTKPGAPPFPSAIEGEIELKNVSYHNLNTGEPILESINLTINPGEMIGISSTDTIATNHMLLIMCGVFNPSHGQVLIDKYDIFQWDHTNLQGRMEYLSGNSYLFRGTILENITLFDTRKKSSALDAASLIELDEMVAQLPKGYETLVGGHTNSVLPSGMLHRIAIARALVVRPRIFLINRVLDVADVDSKRVFKFVLDKLKGNCTIILVSEHERYLAEADRRFSLKKGRLTKMGASTQTRPRNIEINLFSPKE